MVLFPEHHVCRFLPLREGERARFFLMTDNSISFEKPGGLPFPVEWIASNHWKVEELLARMPLDEQIRCVSLVRGEVRQNLLTLSPIAKEVMQELPPEEIYQMIKEIGVENALPVLSLASPEQLQFIFDLDWWQGDKFNPLRALEWLEHLDRCPESSLPTWFQGEDFDQVVVLMQSLIKVVVIGEGADNNDELEELHHFSLDGTYEIYFKVKNYDAVKNLLRLLRGEDESLYFSLMEAVVWYSVTPTVESSYRWRATRLGEHGIPEFTEAMEIYSRLDPEVLKQDAPDIEPFTYEGHRYAVAPTYPFAQLGSFVFLKSCLSHVTDMSRIDTLCWEMVYLANKVMVADKRDPSILETRDETMRKVFGYVSIGLHSASGGNAVRGGKLLGSTWMQPLFQAGYTTVMGIKWRAEQFIRDHGKFAGYLLNEGEMEQLGALVYRFPQVGDVVAEDSALLWRDFYSAEDVGRLDVFLSRWEFFARFSRHCLNLTVENIEKYLAICDFPENRDEVDLLTWLTTALARFCLFKEIDCEPLPEVAAKKFLEIIFMHQVFKDGERVCDEDLIQAFHQKLLTIPMAWVAKDRELLAGLLQECAQHLQIQFGAVNPKKSVDWRFVHGLAVVVE